MATALRRSVFALPVVALSTIAVLGASIASPAGGAAPKMVKGISVFVTDTCPQPNASWQSLANNNMRSVKALGATSVALAFPFYTDSVNSNTVYMRNTCPRTNPARVSPTPARLAMIVKAAHALKLRVTLRPLLDEAGLTRWRGAISPTNLKAWFSSYEKLLNPYLRMAKTNRVEAFSISGELNNMQTNKNWPGLVKYARKLYKGALVVVPTWPGGPMKHAAGTTLGVDAYPRFPNMKNNATAKQVLAGWNRTLHSYRLPPGVPMYEVGINSVDGAYAFPSVTGNGAFNQTIQATWFSAACSFVKSHKLGGVYFWGQWFESNGGQLLRSPNPYAAAQLQPKSQAVIKKCFH